MGKLRAGNGHAEPYGVRFWQIGNELGDETYQKGVGEFCKAMKAVDPSIKLMAAFPSPGLLQNAGSGSTTFARTTTAVRISRRWKRT